MASITPGVAIITTWPKLRSQAIGSSVSTMTRGHPFSSYSSVPPVYSTRRRSYYGRRLIHLEDKELDEPSQWPVPQQRSTLIDLWIMLEDDKKSADQKDEIVSMIADLSEEILQSRLANWRPTDWSSQQPVPAYASGTAFPWTSDTDQLSKREPKSVTWQDSSARQIKQAAQYLDKTSARPHRSRSV